MLKSALAEASFDLTAIAKALDAMDTAQLIAETRVLGLKEQRALFAAAKGFRRWTLDDMVPAATPADQQVIHQGRNTLPAFNIFQKRFGRPSGGSRADVWGYNEQGMRWFTGPGWFVCREDGDEVIVDYYKVPERQMPGWPAVRDNERFPTSAVYGKMIDVVRGVSERVCIGMPVKRGKPMDSFFVLVRT